MLWSMHWRRHYTDESIHTAGSFFMKGQMIDKVYVLPKPKYGGITNATLLTGETIIGQQGAKYVQSLLSSARVPIDVERISVDMGEEYFNSVLRNRAAVHVDISHDAEHKRKALKICNDLDLYVFMTNVQSFPGFGCRFPDVNLLLIAQNNMGTYAEMEYSPVDGVIEGLHVVTARSIRRFLHAAFQTVVKRKRKKVSLVHKQAEWPKTEGVFIDIAYELQREHYSNIEIEPMELEVCVAQLILNPKNFDVIIANDIYGTFLATISSSVCGGANLFSAVEIGDHHAVFKPLQTKLSLTNYKVLSPYGIVSTCVDLLHHLGHKECAKALWCEMLRTMEEGVKTKDFDGSDRGEFIICNIMNKLHCKMFSDK